jgi:hypothetical protein
MNEWSFITAAYTVTWVVLIGYGVYLVRLVRRVTALRDEAVQQSNGGDR